MALIRCSKCGNLASSRSAICPICGEKIAQEQTTPPTPEKSETAEAVNTPVAESPAPNVSAQPKTLHEVLAERQATKTLNDSHSKESTTIDAPTTQESIAAPQESNNTMGVSAHVQYSYDDDVRTVEEYEGEIERLKRTNSGLMMGCIILFVVLIVVGIFYFIKVSDYNDLNDKFKKLGDTVNSITNNNPNDDIDVEALRENAEELVAELEKYKNNNDSMAMRYQEAVAMYKELESSNTYTREQLQRYKKEVETLKGIMRQYVHQIDSLNTVTTTQRTEISSMKKQITDQNVRVNQAEELAEELNTKVRQGSVIQTSAINILALNDNSKEVKRMKVARRLRVDFELTKNALAEPGEKIIYICITNPEGYLLASPDMIVFNYEGTEMMASAMRKVDYENEMVPVSIFYDGESFTKGTYKVDIYIDGRHCGEVKKHFD